MKSEIRGGTKHKRDVGGNERTAYGGATGIFVYVYDECFKCFERRYRVYGVEDILT